MRIPMILTSRLGRAALLFAAVPALLLSALTPASAAPAAGPDHAGYCSASGDYAICAASGTAYRPSIINVHVYATPNQKVDVYWNMVCSKGEGAGSSSGHFSGVTPLSHRAPHPYAQPDNCIVAASAGLDNGGYHIVVKILYWKW